MKNRPEIETAIAAAEAELARVVAVLAKANSDYVESEAGVPGAFSDSEQIRADVAKAEEDLARARASCVAARDRLTKLNFAEGRPKNYLSGAAQSERGTVPETTYTAEHDAGEDGDGAAASGSRADAAGLAEGADMDRTAARRSPPSTAAEPYTAQVASRVVDSEETPVKGRGISTESGTAPQLSVLGAGSGTSRASSARDPRGWRTLGWQTAQLSVLTLAYLQYYFIDINLQIAMLPSPVVPGLLAG
jgi:hypothetical protein